MSENKTKTQPTQILVGAAAIFIIGAGVYFFWGEFKKFQEQNYYDTQAQIAICKKILPQQRMQGLYNISSELLNCYRRGYIDDNHVLQYARETLLQELKNRK